MEISDDQRRIAQMLNLHPDMPESWPMGIIDRLIWFQKNRPPRDFQIEFDRMTKYYL